MTDPGLWLRYRLNSSLSNTKAAFLTSSNISLLKSLSIDFHEIVRTGSLEVGRACLGRQMKQWTTFRE